MQLKLWTGLTAPERVDLVLRLTLVVILLNIRHTGGNLILTFLCFVMLAFGRLLRDRRLWLFISLVFVIKVTASIGDIRTNKLLLAYWTLGLTASLYFPDTLRALRSNARLLLGVLFFLATFWKVLFGQWLDGSFFTYFFLLDERVSGIATLIAGLEPQMLAEHQQWIHQMKVLPESGAEFQLTSTPRLEFMALVSSWLVLGLEALMTIALFSPKNKLLWRWRNLFLALFVAPSYLIFPIPSYALLLPTLGIFQLEDEESWGLVILLAAIAIGLLANLPLNEIFLRRALAGAA